MAESSIGAALNQTDEMPSYPSIPQSLVICVIIILMSLGCAPIMFLGSFLGSEGATFIFYVAAFGSSFYIVHSFRRRRIGSSKYNFGISSWRVALLLFVGGVALLLGVVAPLASLVPISDTMREMMKFLGNQTGVPAFIYFVIAAPLFEELIFRGIMLDGLLKRYKPATAILVSSLLFGVVHLNAIQFITGTVFGCFLGWVYLCSGSVGACMLVHMAANFSGFVMRFFLDIEAATDQQAGILNTYGGGVTRFLIVGPTLFAIFVVSVLLLRKEFDKTVHSPASEIHA